MSKSKRGKRKKYPKKHSFDFGAKVIFRFAGKTRIGRVLEKTYEEVGQNPKGHATYVIQSGKIVYPCIGVDGSKEFGNILTDDTKAGQILKGKVYNETYNEIEVDKRGYAHLQLPKLKDMCKKYKLKVGGTKKEVVERLEKWYYETSNGLKTNTKVNDSFFQ